MGEVREERSEQGEETAPGLDKDLSSRRGMAGEGFICVLQGLFCLWASCLPASCAGGFWDSDLSVLACNKCPNMI